MPQSTTNISVGPWVVEAHPEETREVYSRITDGAEECDCEHCQHWAAHRDQTYPPGALGLLSSLGIDYRREAEVYQAGPAPDEHTCAGWFHFIGRVVSGPPDPESWGFGTDDQPLTDLPLTDEGFQVHIRRSLPPMKKAMEDAYEAGRPVTTLEFFTNLHKIPHELT